MNEELKIIIKAITADAQKNLDQVNKKLDAIKNTSDKSGKSMSSNMTALAKGAAIAAAAVAAVTTAMVALGKSSLEFQRAQAKINAAFQSVGSSAEQAAESYKNVFRFLGDRQRSTEAVQNLSKITTSEKDLAEWTKILQGVYTSFGASLPVETLAEAANETIRTGKVVSVMADALNWAGYSELYFNQQLANTTSLSEREALTREVLNHLYSNAAQLYERNNQSLIKYNESQLKLDQALATATKYVVPLMTALNNLAATLLNILGPAFEYISATLIAFVQWVMAGIKAVASFFGVFGAAESSTKNISNNMSSISNSTTNATSGLNNMTGGLENANKEAIKLKKQLMGFDELNVVAPQQSTSTKDLYATGGDIGAIQIPEVTIPEITLDSIKLPGLDDFEDKVAKIREYITPIATAVGIIATGLGLWKITDFVIDIAKAYDVYAHMTKDDMIAKFGKNWVKVSDESREKIEHFTAVAKKFAGEVLLAGGAIASIAGFSDAWVNGIDWANFALLLGGVATAAGGVALAFGKIPALVTVIVGSIAMIVSGTKDFIDQGPTVQNTILIWGGALAAAIALATMGVGPLIAAIVGLVAAIGATTAAILLEKPAIMSVTEAQEAHAAAIENLMNVELNYVDVMDRAEAAQKRLAEAEKAAGMSGEDLYKQVQDGVLTYAEMTDEQKELYKAYMENEKAQKEVEKATKELEEAKKAEIKASFDSQLALAKESGSYDDFKTSVIEAYKSGKISAEDARDFIEKAMSEMSDSAQQAFMKDIPADIKEGMNPHKYESTKTKIVKFFKNMWQGIKDVFSDLKVWFSNIGKKIGNALSSAATTAINWLLEKAINLVNDFIGSINWAIGFINQIPGVNIGYLNYLSVPRLAEGGIVTGSTLANIGERGKEAVLPLENNTEWMDALADRIAARNSGPSKIILKVGERELGWASINGINQITKQTGGLQLQLV